jgi:hypothetical protein
MPFYPLFMTYFPFELNVNTEHTARFYLHRRIQITNITEKKSMTFYLCTLQSFLT